MIGWLISSINTVMDNYYRSLCVVLLRIDRILYFIIVVHIFKLLNKRNAFDLCIDRKLYFIIIFQVLENRRGRTDLYDSRPDSRAVSIRWWITTIGHFVLYCFVLIGNWFYNNSTRYKVEYDVTFHYSRGRFSRVPTYRTLHTLRLGSIASHNSDV